MPVSLPKPAVPLYFGPADKLLFGCYHEPRTGPSRNCAVVICQPIGHEYVYCHRALRQLAARLSDSGFPVLRFDYYGCGDSSGDAEEGSISQWLQNISAAVSEIRLKANVGQICLIGIRLGAALSLITAAGGGDIDTLVLWDPVVRGTVYLQGLYSLQREALRCRPKPVRACKSDVGTEIIGFPLPIPLRAELENLNLLKITPKSMTSILSIHSDQTADGDCLKHHLSNKEGQFEYRQVQAPRIWLPTVDGSLLVPSQILQSIVSWTCGAHA